ncbi:MAG: DUF484 family protein [Gammaproteobacteria bacterium]|nr:DUF484 family protein [Gammaproteobacteria bacterium]
MSSQPEQQRKGKVSGAISDEAVAHYLDSHPEFFERHASLLGKLQLPHQTGSSAVSLVERQVEILRQRNRKLENQLRELTAIARTNDALSGKIHQLCRRLIHAADFGHTVDLIEASLRQDFNADQIVMVLFRDQLAGKDDYPELRFLRWTTSDAKEMKPFATFFKNAEPRCGQIRDAQRDYLFGDDTNEIASVAMLPLGPGSEIGLLAISSADEQRFHPAMGTDFLSRIGELVSTALTR